MKDDNYSLMKWKTLILSKAYSEPVVWITAFKNITVQQHKRYNKFSFIINNKKVNNKSQFLFNQVPMAKLFNRFLNKYKSKRKYKGKGKGKIK